MNELNYICESWRYIAQAENSLAGCLLVDPEQTVHAIQGIVTVGDFQSDAARAVFTAALALVNGHKACDPVLIQSEAVKLGIPVDNEYCAEAMRMYVTTANVAETARVVHEAAITRRAREIGLSLAQDEISPVESLARLQELLTSQSSKIHTPSEAAMLVMDYINNVAAGKSKPFLRTGFHTLDTQLSGGLVAGGLITLAARPGTGKTTAALNIAENIAASGHKVLYISLEMTEQQLWSCRAACLSGLSRSAIYAGKISENDEQSWRRLSDAFNTLYSRPFFIRDSPSSLEDIEREARCIDDLALLVIDHMGLIKPSDGRKSSRYEFMTDTAHRLKQLALSMRIPILALCQLNRASEQRESKRPTMADLRDSGAIEEDSDVVCLLFREAQYLPENRRPNSWSVQSIDFIIDKNRHGMTGRVPLSFYGMTSRIIEEARYYEE